MDLWKGGSLPVAGSLGNTYTASDRFTQFRTMFTIHLWGRKFWFSTAFSGVIIFSYAASPKALDNVCFLVWIRDQNLFHNTAVKTPNRQTFLDAWHEYDEKEKCMCTAVRYEAERNVLQHRCLIYCFLHRRNSLSERFAKPISYSDWKIVTLRCLFVLNHTHFLLHVNYFLKGT